MLEAKAISHAFDYPLYKDINLSIKPYDSIAILGASGSGKSTLLHNLSSLLKPLSGQVVFEDNDLYEISKENQLKIRRYKFGIIFQQHYLFKGFSGQENINLASLISNQALDTDLAKRFNIDNVLHQNSSTLSGGQQQRVSIVRTLTKKPKIIFADEPTGNLDKESANEVLLAIQEYIAQNSAAFICVTHDDNVASKCKYVYRLENQVLSRA